MKQEEWERYRRQGRHTLDSAWRDQKEGDFDWACFKAQQAAEVTLKGFLRATQSFVTGHSVLKLLGFWSEIPDTIQACARDLDKVYIPARYPDAYDWGSPMDYFDAGDAQTSLDCAERILEWLDDQAAG